MSLAVQYTLVAICVLAAFVWIVVKAYRKSKSGSHGCCGCSLADTCVKVHDHESRRKHDAGRSCHVGGGDVSGGSEAACQGDG